MRRVAGVFALLCCSRASFGAEPAQLDFETSPGCPNRDAFVRELLLRTSEWNESNTAPKVFRVRLHEESPKTAWAAMVVSEQGRAISTRTIEAGTCLDAARALSFVLALSIDPAARAPTIEVKASETDLDSPKPVLAPTPQGDTRKEEPVKRVVPVAPAASRISKRADPVFGAGAHVAILGLAAPSAVVGLGVFGEVRPARAFAVRLGAERTVPSSVETRGTVTTFSWTLVRLEPCVGALFLGRITLRPCGMLDLGVISASGGGSARGADESVLFASLGGAVRAEVSATRAFRLEASAGGFAPLIRDAFSYRPEFVVYRAPPFSLYGGLGAAAAF